MRLSPLLAGVLLLAAAPAAAQDYDQYAHPGHYVPLEELPGIVGGIQRVTFTSSDNSFVSGFPIGFTFDFLGLDVVSFGVSTDGWIGFNPGTSNTGVNATFGSTNPPNGIIAPWWDDLNLASPTLSTTYAVVGTAPNRAVVIETANFSHSPNLNDGGRWQIWMFEKPAAAPGDTMGRFEIRVAGSLDNDYSASTGFEGVTGAPGGQLVSCAPSCTASDFGSMVGQVHTILRSSISELTGHIADFPPGALPGRPVDGQIVLQNLGRTRALAVTGTIYLSRDNALGPGDVEIGETTVSRIDANNGAQSVTVSTSIPAAQQPGAYYLILAIDEADTVREAYHLDNVVVGEHQFLVGYDVELTRVAPGGSANPGDQLSFAVDIRDNGAPLAGQVAVEIYASLDRILDPSDPQVLSTQVTLTNAELDTFDLDATLPALSPGQYHAIAKLIPPGNVVELNAFNNTRASDTKFSTGPDFQVTSVTAPSSVAPGASVTVSTDLLAAGVPYSGNMRYNLFASEDTSYEPGVDHDLGLFTVVWAGGSAMTDDQSVSFAGVPPGAYHILAVADANMQIAETVETNNVGFTNGRIMNAPDFRVSNVTIDNLAQPGQTIAVGADLQTAGVPFSGAVAYRVYLSDDLRLDAGDVVVHDDTVNLSGDRTPLAAQVTLPSTTLVRQWRVIVEIDSDNAIVEANDDNNANASLDVLNIRGADLLIIEIRGPAFGFIGREYPLELTVFNNGVADAPGIQLAVFISDNEIVGTSDQRIFLSTPFDLAAGEPRSFSERIVIPNIPADTAWHIGAIVDIFSAVPESNELNNTLKLDNPIQIAEPSPDLAAHIIAAPAVAAPGESMAISRLIQNQGVQDAPAFQYGYFLSADSTVTPDDIALGMRADMLLTGAESYSVDRILVPLDVPAGEYFLALILDPAGAVAETDETNNVAAGPVLQVLDAPIVFINERLPQATIGVAYEVGLFAMGSPLPLTVSISAGRLPNNLMLGSNGWITGTPDTEELQEFTVRATASGNAFAEKVFRLRVGPPTVRLTITTDSLPAAFARSRYDVPMLAAGGTGIYTWATDSVLPEGLTLTTDGRLRGEPLVVGEYSMTATVTDEIGESAATTLPLFVVTPRQLVKIRQSGLPDGTVGAPYCADSIVFLLADRGFSPYRWSTNSGSIPGLTLDPDGQLCGTPTESGTFGIEARVADRSGLFDTSHVFVTITGGRTLRVSTFELPDAVLDEPYFAEVAAVRGTPPYTFAVTDGALPAKFTMTDVGQIEGVATSTGTFAFLVTVEDADHRTDVQALSIRVKLEDDGGTTCNCASVPRSAPTSSSLAMIALLGLCSLRRRRR